MKMRKCWSTSHIQTSKVISSYLIMKKRSKIGRRGGHYPSTIFHCYSSWVWGIHNKIWLRQQRRWKDVFMIYFISFAGICSKLFSFLIGRYSIYFLLNRSKFYFITWMIYIHFQELPKASQGLSQNNAG